MPETAVTSFIVRFVQEKGTENTAASWRGLIRHIQSSEQIYFACIEDCLHFIDEFVNVTNRSAQVWDQEPPSQQPPQKS